ncbi:hypothetical protein PF005_g13702 [Phytophthora fragariae]|uniref:EF-hand domain-containing protein n=1 Tax=Phytophthora fragariae TaxID=53985 RepID=A0A6A3ERT1_9STRA|nr:hypothetical protein PF003_g31248 [Phytophthora fragariae]KAE8935243.1 hypothetical protein PF009_g14801 [Phytophthora fragariae]KAE9003936.1 hypothetical protein PF011_g12679 [Phytophthora fragariae]KAE9104479.1 hypothetical protein PF010_g13374 [Phytophthora fragariae]KAE9104559.1 hypothetical protein PF007_g14020 [Phytophthora fragariae]
MGIAISQPAEGGNSKDSPLAVAAVAEITQFTLVQLQALQAIWCSEDSREEGELATREADLGCDEFEEALNSVNFAASDRAIFDRLFTLMDRTGDERILAIQLLIGASVLLRGSLDIKLQAALQFASDADSSPGFEGALSPDALTFALTTIAAVASFFGDPLVPAGDVNRVVEDLIGADGNCSCDELVKSLEDHSLVQQYVYAPGGNN